MKECNLVRKQKIISMLRIFNRSARDFPRGSAVVELIIREAIDLKPIVQRIRDEAAEKRARDRDRPRYKKSVGIARYINNLYRDHRYQSAARQLIQLKKVIDAERAQEADAIHHIEDNIYNQQQQHQQPQQGVDNNNNNNIIHNLDNFELLQETFRRLNPDADGRDIFSPEQLLLEIR
jgi:hypothetical protein